MTKQFTIALLSLLILVECKNAKALTIVSPREGEVVYAGSSLTITVKPDPGEKWESVAFGFYPMTYNPLTGSYAYTFTLPADLQGAYDRIIVIGVDKSGNEVELKRKVFVRLPSNVMLQSILVDDYKTLFKLPSGSSLEDIQRIESRQLHVRGIYSDGIKRTLTSSVTGTTYTSSNENIVTVNSEGKMTAQGIGTAKIRVRNGSLSREVEVVVKPYKK